MVSILATGGNIRHCVYVCLICVIVFAAKGVVVHTCECVSECAWNGVINHDQNVDVVVYETRLRQLLPYTMCANQQEKVQID